MELTQQIPGFSSTDRMGLTVFGSVLLHLTIILGISFTVPKMLPKLDSLPNLEITLVTSHNDIEPEEADYLAQANQEGGGESDQPAIPKSPIPPEPKGEPSPQLQRSQPKFNPPKVEVEFMTQPESSVQQVTQVQPKPAEERTSTEPPKPAVLEQTTAQRERARLSAEISRFWEEYQKRPRRTFVNARTREYRYAAYMEAWRAKVERIGNLNYPEEAKQRKLSGALVLDVALDPDGSVNTISVKRPSGHKVLDDAALRIVELAAPFAPFPENIRRDTDILHITRTWQFLQSNRLRSR